GFTVGSVVGGLPTGPGLIGFFIPPPLITTNSSLSNEIVFIPQNPDDLSSSGAVNDINSDSAYDINPSYDIVVCFKSSLETNQVGLITFQAINDLSNISLSYSQHC